MTTLSLADARAGFSRLIESANSTHERFEVTRNGRRMAILLSADDYDGLLETIDVLSDQAGVQALRIALDELHDGEVHSADDVREAMARRRSATD
ncbi:type II toxin-antitoxin system Phd/YefM family antitoxin [Cnuibacter sp. UC19_7]|uniref:type II toxin-antitoxin system Phd/YefM family antitoxin n=1 Tax=Cnuibacter sp. UC19_7 TaxID=3350166 RepID=UPI003672AF81